MGVCDRQCLTPNPYILGVTSLKSWRLPDLVTFDCLYLVIFHFLALLSLSRPYYVRCLTLLRICRMDGQTNEQTNVH